jgi:hypothetical protein
MTVQVIVVAVQNWMSAAYVMVITQVVLIVPVYQMAMQLKMNAVYVMVMVQICAGMAVMSVMQQTVQICQVAVLK